MLSRFFSRSLRLRPLLALTLTSPLPSHPPLSHPIHTFLTPIVLDHSRTFSTNRRDDGNGSWKFTDDAEDLNSLFPPEESVSSDGLRIDGGDDGEEWAGREGEEGEGKCDIFEDIDKEGGVMKESGCVGEEWETAEGFKPWGFDGEEEGKKDIFAIGEVESGLGELDGCADGVDLENQHAEEKAKLEMKDNELNCVLKGADRAFGDLIKSSGITDEMLDSLILLKDVSGVEGLASLEEIEDDVKKDDDKTRSEEVSGKGEEITKATRVRRVDEKGRAYGTGKRKCSIARVFIQRGDGKFIINGKQFDAYFTWLDHRAEILSPFLVTDSVGQWDVDCTVKGGGLTGQVGAIRLGISRALQNWSPHYRVFLRPAGMLTRDSRVVERKKPGKAKARKSFQWVKR